MLKRKMNLQLFADDETEDKSQDELNGATDDKSKDETLTKEDIQKMIQSETDRVRTEYSKKLKEKETELEKLQTEKMTEEEKRQHEIEQREKTLAEKEAELKKERLINKTVNLLKENELSLDFSEFVIGQDEDSTKEKVSTFKKLWDSEMQKSIDNLYKSNGRKVKKVNGESTISKEDFNKMSYSEKVKLYNEDKELYEKLKQ